MICLTDLFLVAHLLFGILGQLVERFSGRLPGYTGPGNDRSSFCHVDDVAYGHLAALDRGRVGERYLLCGEALAIRDVIDIAADLTKTSRPRFTIPLWAVEVYGRASVFFARLFRFMPTVTPEVCFTSTAAFLLTSELAL